MHLQTILPSLLLTLLVCGPFASAEQPTAQVYLERLLSGAASSRRELPQWVKSADNAAHRIVAGGRLWIGGSQADFAPEAVGRAGGLMMIQAVGDAQVRAGDVVLVGVRAAPTADDLREISRWRNAGAYVIAFASARVWPRDAGNVDALVDCGDSDMTCAGGKIIPVDTAMNLINLWTWTGEFTSACTRLGKCPVFFLSYGLPGGYAWARKYHNKKFHDDLSISAIAPEALGGKYLDYIQRTIKGIEHQHAKLADAAQWIRQSAPADRELSAMGHIFPAHFEDPRAPRLFETMSAWGKRQHDRPAHLMLLLGYQKPPDDYLNALRPSDRLIYATQRASDRPTGANVIDLDPCWPPEDACCRIPGYPIPALPASGVAQSAIYWSITAEAVKHQR